MFSANTHCEKRRYEALIPFSALCPDGFYLNEGWFNPVERVFARLDQPTAFMPAVKSLGAEASRAPQGVYLAFS